jgi:hypothetical protein
MIESGDEVKRKAKRNGRKSVFLPAGNVLDNCSYRGVESIKRCLELRVKLILVKPSRV